MNQKIKSTIITVATVFAFLTIIIGTYMFLRPTSDFDKADFPEDASEFVEDCFMRSESELVRLNGDSMSLGCNEQGTMFTTGGLAKAECYLKGGTDWSANACAPGLNAGSIEQAISNCEKQLVIHVENSGIAYCLNGFEATNGIYPGDTLTCYNARVEPAREAICPEEFQQMASLPGDSTESATPTIPQGLSKCEAQMLVVDELGGDTFCVDPEDNIILEDGREYMLSCYDPRQMAAIDCPRDLLGEDAQILNEYPA